MFFTLDIEKAFESFDHCLLFSVLKAFGFGENVISQIGQDILRNIARCVMNNGFTTGYYKYIYLITKSIAGNLVAIFI